MPENNATAPLAITARTARMLGRVGATLGYVDAHLRDAEAAFDAADVIEAGRHVALAHDAADDARADLDALGVEP